MIEIFLFYLRFSSSPGLVTVKSPLLEFKPSLHVVLPLISRPSSPSSSLPSFGHVNSHPPLTKLTFFAQLQLYSLSNLLPISFVAPVLYNTVQVSNVIVVLTLAICLQTSLDNAQACFSLFNTRIREFFA